MVPWIFVHNPLERWLDDYTRIFDAWEEGGVGGIVVGRMWLKNDAGMSLWGDTLTPSFAADPKVYAAFGIKPFIGFMQRFRRHMHKVEIAMGALLVITGALIFANSFEIIGFWLLELFPALGRLG